MAGCDVPPGRHCLLARAFLKGGRCSPLMSRRQASRFASLWEGGMLTYDDYLMPTSLTEALRLWAAAKPGTKLIAGGTDILPWAREGRAGDVHLPALIDLSRVKELTGYSLEGGKV